MKHPLLSVLQFTAAEEEELGAAELEAGALLEELPPEDEEDDEEEDVDVDELDEDEDEDEEDVEEDDDDDEAPVPPELEGCTLLAQMPPSHLRLSGQGVVEVQDQRHSPATQRCGA